MSNASVLYFRTPKMIFILDSEVFADTPPFRASLNQNLKTRSRDQREVLLFVHDYNTDLVDAILRVAHFKHDSGFSDIPVLFTWASRGKTLGYVYDLNSALHARDDLIVEADIVASTGSEMNPEIHWRSLA